MENPKKTSGDYHHGNLKQVLIDKAVELISEAGTKELSLRKVAQRAGVSHSAPYRHFKDKNAILAAVSGQGFDMMLQQTLDRIEVKKAVDLDAFAVCGLSYINFALKHPAYYRVMFGTRTEDSYFSDLARPPSTPIFKLLKATIESCQKKGEIKPGNAYEMTLAAWSIVHGFAMLLIDGHLPGRSMDENQQRKLKQTVVISLYQGLRPE